MHAQGPGRVAAAARNKPVTLGERQPVSQNPEWAKRFPAVKGWSCHVLQARVRQENSRGLRKRTCWPEQTAQSAGAPSRAFPQCLAEQRIQKKLPRTLVLAMQAIHSSLPLSYVLSVFCASLCSRVSRPGILTMPPVVSLFFVVRAPREASRVGSLWGSSGPPARTAACARLPQSTALRTTAHCWPGGASLRTVSL